MKGFINLTQTNNGNISRTKDELLDKIEKVRQELNQSIANLVNSAPETLDTLGEIAKALQDNQGVVNILNSAISTKANKSELPTKTSQLLNDSGFITKSDVPGGDTDKFATKEYVDSVVGNINTVLETILGV